MKTDGTDENTFVNEFTVPQRFELSEKELILADKLYDERDIKLGNLHSSIRTYKTSIAYLETIEP